MAAKVWDVVVVGGGVIGLSTAYHSAKAGKTTLLLEQQGTLKNRCQENLPARIKIFSVPHTRGSSHGQSRIFRRVYEDDHKNVIMRESYDLWRQLERESGQQLIVDTGIVILEKGTTTQLESTRRALQKHNSPHEWLSAQQLAHRYPMTRFDDSYTALIDKAAGVLLSDKCCTVIKDLFVRYGGVVADKVCVNAVYPGEIVTLTAKSRTFQCRHLAVTPGPWATECMNMLKIKSPFMTKPGLHQYWKVKDPSENSDYLAESTPMFYEQLGPTPEFSSRFMLFIPQIEYPNMVKIVSRTEPAPVFCHPDERDSHSMEDMVNMLSRYISEHFPGIATTPSIVESCMYCMTPDQLPVIDRHPQHQNIAIGAGFLSTGFMTAPVSGLMLYELLFNTVTHDLQRYSLARYTHNSKL